MPASSYRCLCCIIPPRMLRKLADSGSCSPAERQQLLDQCELSAQLRGQRAVYSLLMTNLSAGEKRRSIYDAQHQTTLPGKLQRDEGAPPGKDDAANQAYEHAGTTYDFFRSVFQRNSIDNKGLRIDSSVHFQKQFNNAFWNGQQLVYGDGDGKRFHGFTHAIDVVAHELSHGITQYAVPGGLVYEGQSGALNESISDVMGSLVKQWQLKQSVNQADWLIGADIMTPAVGLALRSLADPGNPALTWSGDEQPKHMAGYLPDGDVHSNSGIPNHAFYLSAVALQGYAWEKAGAIWYRALALLTPNASFAEMARATEQAALLLYGIDSLEQRTVRSAWQLVGVTSPPQPAAAAGVPAGFPAGNPA